MTYLQKLSLFTTALLFISLPLLAQPEPEADPNIIDLTAMDYAFGMPSEIKSGWVTFRMKNIGKEEHVAVLEKVSDTLSIEQVQNMTTTSLESGNFAPLFQHTQNAWGGPGLLSAGLTGETTVYLEPGIYVMICGVKTSEGKFHYQEGMIKSLVVQESENQASKPKQTVDITLSNYAFSAKEPLGKGDQIINIKSEESGNHDLHIAKLKPGQSLDLFRKWMRTVEAPSPFEFIGGAEQTIPGNPSTFKVEFTPGRYAVGCHSHAAWGETALLTIPEEGSAELSSFSEKMGTIAIEATEKNLKVPEEIKAGPWNFVVKNTTESPQMFLLHKMDEDKTGEDYVGFMESIAFKGKFIPGKTMPPYQMLPLIVPPVMPGGEKEVFVHIYEGSYVLLGPLTPGVPLPKAWSPEIIHEITAK